MRTDEIIVDLKKLDLNNIDDKIHEVIHTKYWDNSRDKPETNTQYNHRLTWINNGFCTYKKVAELNNSNGSYIENIASEVGWSYVKRALTELYQHKEFLEKERKREEANATHLEIWEHNEKSIKFDLAFIGKEKKRISAELKETTDKLERKQLKNELYGLSEWESRLRKDAREVQTAHRTALGQTNNYKDTAPDKIEMEQTGELTINNNNTGKTREELDKEYEDRFKKYIKNITTNNTDDVQDV